MKVSDGFWLHKSGYQVGYATQWIANRGMTLGGPLLTIRF